MNDGGVLSAVAVGVVLGAAWLLGAGVEAVVCGRERREVWAGYRAVPLLALGFALLHTLMLTLDAAGLPWRRRTLLPAVALAAAALWGLAWWRRRGGGETARPPRRAARPAPAGWGDLVAAAVLALHAWLAVSGVLTTPDFVYHWGLKAHRYLLARGIDWEWLASPLRFTDTADYPNLVPDLYAALGFVTGTFDRAAMLALSVVFFALLLLAAREALERWGVAPSVLQAGMALVALVAGTFGTGYWLAGGGDWPMALALTAALPALVRPGDGRAPAPPRWNDLRVGAVAAFAAGAKLEGVALAGILGLVYLATSRRDLLLRRRPAEVAAALGRLTPVAAAVVALHLLGAWRHGLFGVAHAHVGGELRPHLMDELGAYALRALTLPEWHGLAWLLFVVPLLLAVRAARPVALVVLLQAAVYTFVYLSSPGDLEVHVALSAPRLYFHLLPGALVGATVALGAGWRRSPRGARRLALAALLVVVAAAGAGFQHETRRMLGLAASEKGEGSVARWRPHQRAVRELAGYVSVASAAIEPGRLVAVAAHEGIGPDRFFLALWVAYLLPQNDVLPIAHPRAAEVADYVLAYNTGLEHRRLTPLLEVPQGTVYRVEPPPPAGEVPAAAPAPAQPRQSQEAIASPAAR